MNERKVRKLNEELIIINRVKMSKSIVEKIWTSRLRINYDIYAQRGMFWINNE